jgi:hypothetical protein
MTAPTPPSRARARLPEADALSEWVLVPREPTPGMLRAGFLSESEGFGIDTPADAPGLVYRAMIAAAPTPEACTCPSGDGSLRWPCPSHPPAPEVTNPLDTVTGIDSDWYCELHPEHLQSHEGCDGAGITASSRIPMLVHWLRMARQETRETKFFYEDTFRMMRSATPAPNAQPDYRPPQSRECPSCLGKGVGAHVHGGWHTPCPQCQGLGRVGL